MADRYKIRDLQHPGDLKTLNVVYENAECVLAVDYDAVVAAKSIAEDFVRNQGAIIAELEAALRGLYEDQVDYLRLNHLGGMDNHWMKAARKALRITASGGVKS